MVSKLFNSVSECVTRDDYIRDEKLWTDTPYKSSSVHSIKSDFINIFSATLLIFSNTLSTFNTFIGAFCVDKGSSVDKVVLKGFEKDVELMLVYRMGAVIILKDPVQGRYLIRLT